MDTLAPNSIQARDIAHFIHPQTDLVRHQEGGPVVITRGDGIYVEDDSGRRFLEGAAGLWCASLGFSNERLAKVAYEQMRTLGYYHSYRDTAQAPGVDLAEALIRLAPVPMSKVLFQCSGSEANDAAIKLAWYYHAAIGRPEKRKIIGRRMGYHGSSVAAVSVSGKPDMHADFGLPLADFRHTAFPHWYRMHEEGESEEEFATRMASALEALIVEEGPDTVAAFFAEPVMGAGGAILPPATYFEKIQAVLKQYEVLFVADEVICGFGRTGKMWGSQTYDLQPDMITCAKALSAAFQPISAVMVNDKVWQAMLVESRKLGNFAHGATYCAHPVAAAVALEVLKIYDEMDVVAHVGRVGARLQQRLAGFADHPLVGDVRGVGLLAGLEIVEDKATRHMFDPDIGVGSKLDRHLKEQGLILRIVGNRLCLSPPLIITEAEVDEMVARMGRALDATQRELSAS